MTAATEVRGAGPRVVAALDARALELAVVAIGLAVRVAWALSRRHDEVGGDAYYFHHQANLIADGHGFVNPLIRAVDGLDVAAADHPPLYSAYLAVWSFLGVRSPTGHLLASALLGTATVALVAAAARRLGGPRVGALAGLLAALHPNLWTWDGMLLSETAAGAAVALFLWCAVRAQEDPTPGRLAAVGAAAGLAALGRSELALLVLAVPLLALPRRREGWGRVAAVAGCGLAAAVAVVAPWSAYNQTRFTHPVPLSTGAGLVLVSSNCDSTYSGPLLGYWDFGCSVDGSVRAGLGTGREASEADRLLRDDAVEYARDHAGRLPVVALARLGRVTGTFRPFQQVTLLQESEGVPRWIGAAGLGSWYLLAGLAVVGTVTLRRARVAVAPLLAPVAAVLLVAVAVYGIWRFRAPGDVAVCLLAAVGVDALVRSRLEGGRPPEGGLLRRRR